MNTEPVRDIQALFKDGAEIDAALAEGVRQALIMHKRMGYPIVTWRDGQVVWVPPEEIEVDDSPIRPANGSPASNGD